MPGVNASTYRILIFSLPARLHTTILPRGGFMPAVHICHWVQIFCSAEAGHRNNKPGEPPRFSKYGMCHLNGLRRCEHRRTAIEQTGAAKLQRRATGADSDRIRAAERSPGKRLLRTQRKEQMILPVFGGICS